MYTYFNTSKSYTNEPLPKTEVNKKQFKISTQTK